jgi:hypothetical protein
MDFDIWKNNGGHMGTPQMFSARNDNGARKTVADKYDFFFNWSMIKCQENWCIGFYQWVIGKSS